MAKGCPADLPLMREVMAQRNAARQIAVERGVLIANHVNLRPVEVTHPGEVAQSLPGDHQIESTTEAARNLRADHQREVTTGVMGEQEAQTRKEVARLTSGVVKHIDLLMAEAKVHIQASRRMRDLLALPKG